MGFWRGFGRGLYNQALATGEDIIAAGTAVKNGAVAAYEYGTELATNPAAREELYTNAEKLAESTVRNANQFAHDTVDYAQDVYGDPDVLVNDLNEIRDSALSAYNVAEDFVVEGAENAYEFAQTASSEEWGEVIGGGTFHVATLAAGPALKGVQYGAKGLRVARVADKIEDVADAADDVADAAKVVDKADDARDATRSSEALGDSKVDTCDGSCPLAATAKTTIKPKDRDEFLSLTKDPPPNSVIEFDGMRYETDELGRPTSVSGVLRPGDSGNRVAGLDTAIGKEGHTNDIGFHLGGDQFGFQGGRLNVVPGNKTLNSKEYLALERELAKIGKENKVEATFKAIYNEGNLTNRPDAFEIEYRVNGGPPEGLGFLNID